jgi:hypothetical protein
MAVALGLGVRLSGLMRAVVPGEDLLAHPILRQFRGNGRVATEVRCAKIGACRWWLSSFGGRIAGVHPNIQGVGFWIGLFSLSASRPLTLRTSDQISHQINTANPMTGETAKTRTVPTARYSSPIQNVRI